MRSIPERTFVFGVRVVRFSGSLPRTPAGFAIASQLVRSGTGIGANVEEAQDASSRKEFVRFMVIALKEARETLYWLRIIHESKMVTSSDLRDLLKEAQELVKILITSVKNSRKQL